MRYTNRRILYTTKFNVVVAGAPVLECLSTWTNAGGVMYVLARDHSSASTRVPTCQVAVYLYQEVYIIYLGKIWTLRD